MKDDRYPRTRYSDVLGEDPSRERVRLVEDIQALYSPQQPPQSVASSVRMAIREEAEKLRAQEAAHATRVWPRPVRRSLGVAGFAGFALLVAAVALGLSAMLSRMGPASSADTAATGNGGNAGAVAGSASTEGAPAISPLLSGSGVLHIKGTKVDQTNSGDVINRWTIEFWYDRATGDARYETKTILGSIPYSLILLRQGERYSMYSPVTGSVDSVSRAAGESVASMPKPVDIMFDLKMRLSQGRMKRAVDVAVPQGQIAVTRLGDSPENPVAFLDQATGLPMKVINVHFRSAGRSYEGKYLYEYPVIETLDRASLPRDLFDIYALTPVPPAPTEEPVLLMPPGTQTVPGPTVVPDQPATPVPNQPTVAPAH
jgi:hypothetical protein